MDRACAAAGRVGSLAFVAIVAITTWEVVMRYGFAAPTDWVHEISVLLAASAFVLGGPAAHAQRSHIAITAMVERLPARVHPWLQLFNSLMTLVFLALLGLAAVTQAAVALRDGETSGTALDLPTPVFLKGLLALACVALCLQTLGHAWQDLRRLRHRSPP